EIGQLGGFVDIRSLIAPDNSLSWDDYFPVFRESIVTYDGAVVGLPVYVGFSYMTYRRDVLADRGLVVPNTWDDVLEVARLINGTDMSGDGIGDAAICLSADGLGLFKLLINIFASIAQLGGSENGYLVDPATLGSLANSPAMTRTIEILRALAPYTVTAGIIPYSTPFIELKCAFIFQDIDIFKSTLGFVERNPHYGRTGVSIMPGSSVYLERSNNTLRPCNPTVCSDRETLLNGTVISLNRAPVIGPALLTAINPATPASFQAIVYSFLSYALGPVSNMYVYSPLIPIGPMRFSHMQQYMWLQVGYALQDTLDALNAISRTMSHPNLALDLRLPSAGLIRDTVFAAALEAVQQPPKPASDIAASLHVNITAILAAAGNIEDLKVAYWKAIRYSPPSSPPPGKQLSASTSPSNSILGVAIGVPVAVVVTLVLCAAAAACLLSWQRKSGTFLGKVLAPGPGTLTTLLITDIEGATTLTEEFPDLFDLALHQHNQVLLHCALQHSGYCSATEGDSLIIAFPTPSDAVLFAVMAQEALLEADYPEDLFASPRCAPLWVQHPPLTWLHRPQALTAPSLTRSNSGFIGFLRTFTKRNSSKELYSTAGVAPSAPSFSTATHSRALLSSDQQASSPSNALAPQCNRRSVDLVALRRRNAGVDSAGRAPALPERHDVRHMRRASMTDILTSGPLMWAGAASLLAASLREYLQDVCTTFVEGGPGMTLAFRGVRVRMGMHCGVTEEEVTYNRSVGRTQYRGPASTMTRSVCDAAVGGMVLLSEACFVNCDAQPLGSAVVFGHAGEHQLRGQEAHSAGCDADLQAPGNPDVVNPHQPHSSALHQRTGQHTANTIALLASHPPSTGATSAATPRRGSTLGLLTAFSRHFRTGSDLASLFPSSSKHSSARTSQPDQTSTAYAPPQQTQQHDGSMEPAADHRNPAGPTSLLSHAPRQAGAQGAGGLREEGRDREARAAPQPQPNGVQGVNLYQALSPRLLVRLPLLAPPRTMRQLALGFLDSPWGHVSIVYLKPTGLPSLMAWNADIAKASLAIFHTITRDELCSHQGYMCDVSDELGVLAAFPRPGLAVRCCLMVVQRCLSATWDPQLLEHPLGEEVASSFQGTPQGLLQLNPGAQQGVLGQLDRDTRGSYGSRRSNPFTLQMLSTQSTIRTSAHSGRSSRFTFGEGQSSFSRSQPYLRGVTGLSSDKATSCTSRTTQVQARDPVGLASKGIRRGVSFERNHVVWVKKKSEKVLTSRLSLASSPNIDDPAPLQGTTSDIVLQDRDRQPLLSVLQPEVEQADPGPSQVSSKGGDLSSGPEQLQWRSNGAAEALLQLQSTSSKGGLVTAFSGDSSVFSLPVRAPLLPLALQSTAQHPSEGLPCTGSTPLQWGHIASMDRMGQLADNDGQGSGVAPMAYSPPRSSATLALPAAITIAQSVSSANVAGLGLGLTLTPSQLDSSCTVAKVEGVQTVGFELGPGAPPSSLPSAGNYVGDGLPAAATATSARHTLHGLSSRSYKLGGTSLALAAAAALEAARESALAAVHGEGRARGHEAVPARRLTHRPEIQPLGQSHALTAGEPAVEPPLSPEVSVACCRNQDLSPAMPAKRRPRITFADEAVCHDVERQERVSHMRPSMQQQRGSAQSGCAARDMLVVDEPGNLRGSRLSHDQRPSNTTSRAAALHGLGKSAPQSNASQARLPQPIGRTILLRGVWAPGAPGAQNEAQRCRGKKEGGAVVQKDALCKAELFTHQTLAPSTRDSCLLCVFVTSQGCASSVESTLDQCARAYTPSPAVLSVGLVHQPAASPLQPSAKVQGYHGRSLNRAARVVAVAKSGQVWVTQTTWDECGLEDLGIGGSGEGNQSSVITAVQLGPHTLRGIPEPVELVQAQMEAWVMVAMEDPTGPPALAPPLPHRSPSPSTLHSSAASGHNHPVPAQPGTHGAAVVCAAPPAPPQEQGVWPRHSLPTVPSSPRPASPPCVLEGLQCRSDPAHSESSDTRLMAGQEGPACAATSDAFAAALVPASTQAPQTPGLSQTGQSPQAGPHSGRGLLVASGWMGDGAGTVVEVPTAQLLLLQQGLSDQGAATQGGSGIQNIEDLQRTSFAICPAPAAAELGNVLDLGPGGDPHCRVAAAAAAGPAGIAGARASIRPGSAVPVTSMPAPAAAAAAAAAAQGEMPGQGLSPDNAPSTSLHASTLLHMTSPLPCGSGMSTPAFPAAASAQVEPDCQLLGGPHCPSPHGAQQRKPSKQGSWANGLAPRPDGQPGQLAGASPDGAGSGPGSGSSHLGHGATPAAPHLPVPVALGRPGLWERATTSVRRQASVLPVLSLLGQTPASREQPLPRKFSPDLPALGVTVASITADVARRRSSAYYASPGPSTQQSTSAQTHHGLSQHLATGNGGPLPTPQQTGQPVAPTLVDYSHGFGLHPAAAALVRRHSSNISANQAAAAKLSPQPSVQPESLEWSHQPPLASSSTHHDSAAGWPKQPRSDLTKCEAPLPHATSLD
ncbi:hypothetical protein QJQ45_018524, partial [Haematococcus lacustris]